MIDLIFKLSDKFNINPLIMFGLVFLLYGLKINNKLHEKKDEENKQKDEKIEKLKKENDKLREEKFELELKESFKNQSGMIYFNEEEME